jgi:U3 small nucleolar RNA-associated protein 7
MADDEDLLRRKQALEASALTKYGRGPKITTSSRVISDPKRRRQLKSSEQKHKAAAILAKQAELLHEHDSGLLEAEGELERTYKVRQDEIVKEAPRQVALESRFSLKLEELGPYKFSYSRNGRGLLLLGKKGHVATMDWREGKLGAEITEVGEIVRDGCWLHNNQYFASAQKEHVYIYDGAGVQIHRLDQHKEVTHMEFLPYHFLLATVGKAGYLKYTDTSTGKLVIEMPTKSKAGAGGGEVTAFRQNPWNAIVHVGHERGTISLWSPNSTDPLVKMLVHRGPVRSIAVDREGRYMVSSGDDMKMAVWDIRMFKEVHRYNMHRPGSSIDISDRNVTAVAWGTQVTMWNGLFDKSKADQEKVQSPYMKWGGDGLRIERVRFCPFEDVLGISHSAGFDSIIVPGAGEPNYDALEANPYESKKQRQEGEVKMLLNKLQPGMIALEPDFVGNLDRASHETRMREKDLDRKPEDKIDKLKNRGRGRNSALRRLQRKKGGKNIITEEKLRIEDARKQGLKKEMERVEKQRVEYGPALARFVTKER